MRLYAITSRTLYPGTPEEQFAALFAQARVWVRGGVECIQLREKDLHGAEIEALACGLGRAVAQEAEESYLTRPLLLLNANSGEQAALAHRLELDGVHLPAHAAITAADVRAAWSGAATEPVISWACHSVGEVRQAREARASLVLFAPVFEKPLWTGVEHVRPAEKLAGSGLAELRAACRAASKIPVFALGGVTVENAAKCVEAGAAGVAGIRLFAGDAWEALSARVGVDPARARER